MSALVGNVEEWLVFDKNGVHYDPEVEIKFFGNYCKKKSSRYGGLSQT